MDAQLTHLLAQGKQFSIDTRTVEAGDVYIALHGETLDGHDFIPQAIERGADCLIVDHDIEVSIPYIKVPDTLKVLQQLAAAHRAQCSAKAVAVTGSCGKTTTRAFLQHVFAQAGATHASVGSFNNHIGVPLTLLKLKPSHQFLISEIGANHKREIAGLVPLVKPDVAIITNVAAAHLEGFGSSLSDVAEAKSEIFQGLSANGTAVINNDDQFANFWHHLNRDRQVLTFGVKHDADVMADNIHFNDAGMAAFTLVLPQTVIDVQLHIIGEHNVHNALAAAAAGYALGLCAAQIKAGLEAATTEQRRLVETKLSSGTVVIDDSYNANPLSTTAAINILARKPGATILVFADMKELGERASLLHEQIGETAKQSGIGQIYCYGELARHAANAFGAGGFYFDSKDALIQQLTSQLTPGQTILVKGSNSMKMNEVVEALKSWQVMRNDPEVATSVDASSQ